MNKKKLIVWLSFFCLLSGCASINFSSKYYTLPSNYEKDIADVWQEIMAKGRLKHPDSYAYKIVKDDQTKPAGIPQIGNNVIALPEYFLKYIWEFYYPKSHKEIIGCIFAHELGHPESGFSDKPPEQHYLCDRYSITNLLPSTYSPSTYYSAQLVVRDYWSARKGAGGHLANMGWNAANLVSLGLIGYGYFRDWFATDLDTRLSLMRREFKTKFIFKRNK